MKLHFLGTAGYHPSQERQTSCLMIPEAGLVLDAGTGFFRVRDLIQNSALDVLLTHGHLDHCCGLTYLLDVLYGRSVESVTLWARAQDVRAVREGLFNSPLFPLPFQYAAQEISGEFQLREWKIRTRSQVHPGGSIGYRLEAVNVSLAYITDTTADAADRNAVEFIKGVDLLVHECNFSDAYRDLAMRSGHSIAGEVARTAEAADVGRLVLTHVNPFDEERNLAAMLSEVQSIFPRTELAYDGMTVDLRTSGK